MKLLHTQTFPRHSWLLLEHWKNSSVSQESGKKEHHSSENPMCQPKLQEAQAGFTIKQLFNELHDLEVPSHKVLQITIVWQLQTASQEPAFNIICC